MNNDSIFAGALLSIAVVGGGVGLYTHIRRSHMRDGLHDKNGILLHTLEQYLNNPISHPYVSVFGREFQYGQQLSIDAWPNVVFKVVDEGPKVLINGKVVKIPSGVAAGAKVKSGFTPIGICVSSESTQVPDDAIVLTIVNGNKSGRFNASLIKEVIPRPPINASSSNFNQDTVMGFDLLGCND